MDCHDVELSLVLTDDKEIQQLNKAYRKKNKPTDVLSFPQQEIKRGYLKTGLLGDIVISMDTAFRQAKEYEVSEADELLRLLIHGLLHLLGYDHERVSTAKARAMQKKEKQLFLLVKPEQKKRS